MFPSTIPREQQAPEDSNEWEVFVLKTMSLPSWIAFHRTSIKCEPAERISVASCISRKLGLGHECKRSDYNLTDDQLLRLAKSVVLELHWDADAQWALQQWEEGGFDPTQGDYVAMYLKRIRGYSNDPEELRDRIAKQFGVPPQRILVDCLHDYVANRG